MRHDIKRARVALVSAAILGVLIIAPAQADRAVTVADVENSFHKVEAASEKVNEIGEEIKATKSEIATIRSDIQRDQKIYDEKREQLSTAIVQQQLNAPLGPTVSLLGSENPTEFIDGLGAIQALNSTRADALQKFDEVRTELRNREAQLEERREHLARAKSKADQKRDEIRDRYADAKAKLAQLSAPDRAAFNASDTSLDFEPKASGRAKAALNFALAQLGDPYSWGGNGPNVWDCSGLTKGAYAAAGVSIGRVVSAQYGAGHSVPMNALKPGDLVFYGDMSHVGIYVGNGRVVHSPRPGKTVEIGSVGRYSVARRIVG